MEKVDELVADFGDSLNEKLEGLARKHLGETAELLRIKMSYQRLLKRKYPLFQGEDKLKGDRRIQIDRMGVGETTT